MGHPKKIDGKSGGKTFLEKHQILVVVGAASVGIIVLILFGSLIMTIVSKNKKKRGKTDIVVTNAVSVEEDFSSGETDDKSNQVQYSRDERRVLSLISKSYK